jgi:hypothetical protein
MGSALFFSGLLREAFGWRTAWAVYAALALVAALVFLKRTRERKT